jgi:D-alanine-D-alanine ligase
VFVSDDRLGVDENPQRVWERLFPMLLGLTATKRKPEYKGVLIYYIMKKILIAVAFNEHPTNDTLDAERCRDSVASSLSLWGYKTDTLYIKKDDFKKDASELVQKVNSCGADCIFNLFEGFNDNPGREIDFVKMLEKAGMAFTGNPSEVLEKCLNKELTKKILVDKGVLTPRWLDAKEVDFSSEVNLTFPLFIKPCCQDASVGIDEMSLVYNRQELIESIHKKKNAFPRGLMVSEFVGGNEYNVGFLSNGETEILGISVIDYSKYKNLPHYLSYSAKWEKKSDEYRKIIPDPSYLLDKGLKQKIKNTAIKAAGALGCRSYFRVDMREKNRQIYVIDINPNPDINIDSGYIRQAQNYGYEYKDVIKKIVDIALNERLRN